MPNHVYCELTASPGLLDAIAGEGQAIDFEKILPIPAAITAVGEIKETTVDWAKFATGRENISLLLAQHRQPGESFRAGAYGAAASALHQASVARMLMAGPFPKDFSNEEFESLILAMRAIRATGFAYWREWNIENWGTKWNAYETKRVSPEVVTFQCAWSPPISAIFALSDRYPVEEIRLRWADQDFGANVGEISLRAGQVSAGGPHENESREAFALALELIYFGTVPEGARLGEAGDLIWEEDE